MRARAYCAHSSTHDHWALRCMSRCLNQVVSPKRDSQCLSPQASSVHIYRPTARSLQVLSIQGSPPVSSSRALLIGRSQKSPLASLVLFVRNTQKHSRAVWTKSVIILVHHLDTPPVFYNPILSTPTEATGFFSYRLRLLSMGAGSLFTIMTASLGVGACPRSNNKQWPHGHVHLSFNIWLKP
ncbi:hypothetical protein TNCV_103121 [Trichonephila clavipes]|nr:hypothetical protein TNCV_103121 [Trichonephila clavipes]